MDERHCAYSERAPANEERDYLESSPEFVPQVVRPGDFLSSDERGVPYRAEAGGLVHAVEGSRLVPDDPKTFFMWTRCGGDIGVTEVFASNEAPSCPDCDSEPRVELHDESAQALKRLRLADLALARAWARVYRLADMEEEDAALEAAVKVKQFEAAVQAAEKEYVCLRR
jgi:hypothetical protein